jgi:uncharacterized protein (TIGR02217 family)
VTIPIFPVLSGQGWSVHKKPRFDTKLAIHVTGRETRAGKYIRPIWDFELTFDGLDGSATNIYGGLGADSFQTLAGFFLQVQGRYGNFLYIDPSDDVVSGQLIGVGDGTTTNFTMVRSLGGFSEPVGCVTSVAMVYLNGAHTYLWTVNTPNTLTFTNPPAAGVTITADFAFAYLCRFAEDQQDYEEFMSLLHLCKTITFQSVRAPRPSDSLPGPFQIIIQLIVTDPTVTSWTAPANLLAVVSAEAWGGGGGGDWGGGSGGPYAIVRDPPIVPGQVCEIQIGVGCPADASGAGFWFGSGAGKTYFKSGSTIYVQSDGTPPEGAQPGGVGSTSPGGGGGGAGGPNGPGAAGAVGGGGIGVGGGAASGGQPGSAGFGGAAFDGSPGGAPGGGAGTDGSGGGGGGGFEKSGGPGGRGVGYDAGGVTSGPGGGGGGGDPGLNGGAAGFWSGGGGTSGSGGAGAPGAGGALILTVAVGPT